MSTVTTTTSNTTSTATNATAALATASVPRYAVDASHSSVGFAVRHLMITNVRGEFSEFAGTFGYDPTRPEQTKLDATVQLASINTREPKRDAHLRSADFFDVERFPVMTFASTSARRHGDGVEVLGNLTIHGVTKPVTLVLSDITAPQADPWGNQRIGAAARATISRAEFGMTWNAVLEAGGVAVSDTIKIEIEASLVLQPA